MGEKDTQDGVWINLAFNLLITIYRWLKSIVMAFVPKRLYSKDVRDQIVLVTGGGSGIGQLLAIRFAKLGSVVVIWDVNDAGMDETRRLVGQFGGTIHKYLCDVSDRKNVYAVAELVKKEVGIVNILINNAGIVNGRKFLEIDDDKIEKVFQVNTLASYWTCKAFLPDMIERDHGHLVFVSSMAGMAGSTHLTDYCSSKFAIIGFEEALRLELRSCGIRGVKSTCVCPYFTNTGLFNGVSTAILPLLEPSYVADCVVNGILTNQAFVLVPWSMLVLFVLKMMLPIPAQYSLYDSIGGNTMMSKFTGRAEGKHQELESKAKKLNGFVDHDLKERIKC